MDLTIKLYVAVERTGKIFVFNEEHTSTKSLHIMVLK